MKRLGKLNKAPTFAPATTHTFLEILTNYKNRIRKFIFKKGSKKFVRFENGCYICTPLKRATFIEILTRKTKRKRKIYFSKKLFKILARIKRSVTFAAANREVGLQKRRIRS